MSHNFRSIIQSENAQSADGKGVHTVTESDSDNHTTTTTYGSKRTENNTFLVRYLPMSISQSVPLSNTKEGR